MNVATAVPGQTPSGGRHRTKGPSMSATAERPSNRRFVTAGLFLGVGLGGFVDGIVLHQILQWHHMLTSTGTYSGRNRHNLEVNTLWDGLFHATTWVLVVIGLALLWRLRLASQASWSGRSLLSST